jgi:1-deoxy-D-xylulose-5-phosphate reductoisomerase
LDNEAFPAVELAREVGTLGGTAPAVFNAANEECVEAFLKGRLAFTGIVDTVAKVVAEHGQRDGGPAAGTSLTVEDVLHAEDWARARARELAAG